MNKAFQYIFIIAWLSLVSIGMINPKNLMKLFPISFRMIGIDPNNPSKGVLIFFRIVYLVFFLFGLFVAIGVLTGKLQG